MPPAQIQSHDQALPPRSPNRAAAAAAFPGNFRAFLATGTGTTDENEHADGRGGGPADDRAVRVCGRRRPEPECCGGLGPRRRPEHRDGVSGSYELRTSGLALRAGRGNPGRRSGRHFPTGAMGGTPLRAPPRPEKNDPHVRTRASGAPHCLGCWRDRPGRRGPLRAMGHGRIWRRRVPLLRPLSRLLP